MSEYELNKIIAENITRQLELHNVTQLDLAEYMNVTQATVSNWCKGLKMPRMSKIDMICQYFGINRSDLIEDKKETAATNYIQVDNTERTIIQEYRKSDDITKAMVLRALSIDEALSNKKGVERRA